MSRCCHATPAAHHPLDPLRSDELAAVAAAIRAEHPALSFVSTRLEEPDKASLRVYEQGGARPARQAFAVLLDRATGAAFEAWVALEPTKLVRIRQLPTERAPYGQPPLLLEAM